MALQKFTNNFSNRSCCGRQSKSTLDYPLIFSDSGNYFPGITFKLLSDWVKEVKKLLFRLLLKYL
jgi:hypothetical protein